MKRTGWTASPAQPYHRATLESFVTALIIYSVVMDPVGNTPIFVAVTQHQDRARKLRTALEGTVVATMIMLFFALCGCWVLAYLNISEATFGIAGGIFLFLVALDMLSARRKQRKREVSTREDEESEPDNVAIFPLAPPACRPFGHHVGDRRHRRLCWERFRQPHDRLRRPAGGNGAHRPDPDRDRVVANDGSASVSPCCSRGSPPSFSPVCRCSMSSTG